jgi:hypothetical protein
LYDAGTGRLLNPVNHAGITIAIFLFKKHKPGFGCLGRNPGYKIKEVRNVKEVYADRSVKHIFYLGVDSRRIFGNRTDRYCADAHSNAGCAGFADAAGNTDGNTIADTDAITEPDQSVGPGANTDGESNGSHAEPSAITDTEQVREVRN